MKKVLVLAATALASCESSTPPVPTSAPFVESKFKRIEERMEISSGYISVYTYGTDTLYVVEGRSQSYPVSISVK